MKSSRQEHASLEGRIHWALWCKRRILKAVVDSTSLCMAAACAQHLKAAMKRTMHGSVYLDLAPKYSAILVQFPQADQACLQWHAIHYYCAGESMYCGVS